MPDFFANTHGSCFKVYKQRRLQKGNPVSEVNGHSEDIPDGGEDGGSMQLCNMPPHCLSSFTATVLNMKLIESNPKLYQATTPKPEMFVNNGNNTIEEVYNTTEIIAEIANFNFPPALIRLHSIYFKEKAVLQFKNSMATILPASKACKGSGPTLFKDETGIENVMKSYEISRKKEFQVQQKAKNHCDDRQSNAPLTSSDIRKGLEIKDEMEMRILDTHVQADNFTVVVE
ncbi:hypothetical protein Ocin01_18041, partial [Orchesella cincta]